MADRRERHLSEEAIFDLLDGALAAEARIEAERHVRGCPGCTHSVQRARALFAQLDRAAEPRLDRDLAPEILARLGAKRAGSRGLMRILAAEAVVAIAALAAPGLQIGRWIEALPTSAAYTALQAQAVQLMAEVVSLLTPFVHLVPTLPARFPPLRIEVPHLGGPLLGWAGLAAAALALGVVGNVLLLRAPNDAGPSARSTRHGKRAASGAARRGVR